MLTSELAPKLIGAKVAIQWPNGDRVSGVLGGFDARADIARTGNGSVAVVVYEIHAKVGQFEVELSGREQLEVLE